jgi:hypothetical protein
MTPSLATVTRFAAGLGGGKADQGAAHPTGNGEWHRVVCQWRGRAGVVALRLQAGPVCQYAREAETQNRAKQRQGQEYGHKQGVESIASVWAQVKLLRQRHATMFCCALCFRVCDCVCMVVCPLCVADQWCFGGLVAVAPKQRPHEIDGSLQALEKFSVDVDSVNFLQLSRARTA